ncbi:D-inositol-3-phosphate glycosyltransferase [uncultured archaeon]|nr:D-inositol-3-phosphate glycosyltransferase [uncultured archaeon]
MTRIAIIRGLSLNKFEMQSYEPLKKYFDITAYYTNNHFADVSIIDLPKKELRALECVIGCPLSKLMDYPLRLLGYREAMIGLVDELKSYDIVHTAETYNGYSYQAIKAKEKYGTKVVVSCWENIPFFCEYPNMRSYIKKKVRDNADLFIAVTEKAKEALIYEGVPEKKISLIPVGINLDTFKPERKNEEYLKKLNLSKDDFIILSIGRLVWDKGFFDIIYAAKRILLDPELREKSIKFVFIGSGKEEKTMRKLINKLGLTETVKMAGTFPYNDIPMIHNIADIFLLPSIPVRNWQEQFGMVFAEALACGKPVIAGESGSIPEVVGDAGILIQPNDPLSIYREIKRLVIDDALREKYQKSARPRAVEVFDPEKIALKIKAEYDNLR